MTLFRKIYKQANDDIKPSEDMINRVILNAHKGAEKRQSPCRIGDTQNMRYRLRRQLLLCLRRLYLCRIGRKQEMTV